MYQIMLFNNYDTLYTLAIIPSNVSVMSPHRFEEVG